MESPGGRYLAVRSSSQQPGTIDRQAVASIRVWDTRTGALLAHVRPPANHQLGIFSPDARLLVTTTPSGTIHLWELATGKERMQLRGHLAGNVAALLFTPDGRSLFSGGDDTQVLEWDLIGQQGK